VETSPGGILHGRRYSECMHRRSRAKEAARMDETRTLATITCRTPSGFTGKIAGDDRYGMTAATSLSPDLKVGVSRSTNHDDDQDRPAEVV